MYCTSSDVGCVLLCKLREMNAVTLFEIGVEEEDEERVLKTGIFV
jgi:hypothetical protein